MKAIVAKVAQSKSNPEWSYINFKPFRNEADEVVMPGTKFMLTADVEELELKEGDTVVL